MGDQELEPWQYRLVDEAEPEARSVGPYWLRTAPDLPICTVRDGAGTELGVLLGHVIDLDARRLVADHWTTPGRFAPGDDPDRFVLTARRSLGGRFLWIFAAGKRVRIYPDCSAQVPCVYDPAARIAGSTADALFDTAAYEGRFDPALYARLGIEGEGWYPAGLTAHRGLSRLLPDHVLDLDDWTVRRTWPAAALETTAVPEAGIDEMVDLVRAQIEALLDGTKRVGLALTAGHETRMLLACARPWLDRIDFITVAGGDRHRADTVIADRIAADLGLNHIVLPRQEATEAERQGFIRRGGHCNADSNARFHPSVWPIASSHCFLGGLGGEIGRAFLWRASDEPATPITTQALLGRLGLPNEERLLAALEAWRAGLPAGTDSFGLLDLAYHENRNGPWYAVQFCADPTLVRFAPLMTDRGVELMLRLPPDWKRASRLGHEVIARYWPELARYPYNSLGRLPDLMQRLRRAAADPRVILKKLRKMTS